MKQRVISDKGHLSNKYTGQYLNKTIGDNTKCIILAHLSENNNTPELALEQVNDEIKDKYKNSSYLMSLFAKYTMNKKLKEELNKDSNINFLNLLTKNGDISTFVSDEINKYSKYLLPIAMFTEKVYGDAMDALDKMDENEEEIQINENVSVVNNNSNIQKLRELYTEYGVDSYYLDETSSLWYLNYNEALVKLKFCEDYYMLNNNCSAAGTLFQAEVLYMNSIEFKIKFETDMSDLVDKYIRQEVIVAENSNNVQYRKVM